MSYIRSSFTITIHSQILFPIFFHTKTARAQKLFECFHNHFLVWKIRFNAVLWTDDTRQEGWRPQIVQVHDAQNLASANHEHDRHIEYLRHLPQHRAKQQLRSAVDAVLSRTDVSNRPKEFEWSPAERENQRWEDTAGNIRFYWRFHHLPELWKPRNNNVCQK